LISSSSEGQLDRSAGLDAIGDFKTDKDFLGLGGIGVNAQENVKRFVFRLQHFDGLRGLDRDSVGGNNAQRDPDNFGGSGGDVSNGLRNR
jgi:hypothetical protein